MLDTTLPYVTDIDLETLVDQRANALARQLDVSPTSSTQPSPPYGQKQRADGGRGQLVLQFMEKRRRKGWFGGKADEELVWETWVLDVTLASPRTETGKHSGCIALTSVAWLTGMNRSHQGTQSDGEVATEDRHEDHNHRQS